MAEDPLVAVGRFDDDVADEPYPGVVRRSFSSDQATVTGYWFEPGAIFPIHHHAQEQITLVREGELEFTVGDRVHALSPGAWCVVAPGVEHGLTAGVEGAHVIAIVVPRRERPDAYSVVDPRARA
jgi:quercetin dioxygenase-like cupin family protein